MFASRSASIGLFFAVALSTTAVHAQPPSQIWTLEHGAWPETVAALQSDVGSQGESLSVCVRDGGACLPCDRYTLQFDDGAAEAFTIGACDARTRLTTVSLVDRPALFDHTHVVPRPRAIGLRAAVVRSIESVGGAASTGGSSVGCTARVRPYLRDLEHGTVVYLDPSQFDLRPSHAAISVSAIGSSWVLQSDVRLGAEVAYDVIERASGETVLTGHATLACGSETSTASAGDEPSPMVGDARFESAARGRTTRSAVDPRDAAELRVESDEPATVFVDGTRSGRTPLSLTLSPDEHLVRVVDDSRHAQERIVPLVRNHLTVVHCRFDAAHVAEAEIGVSRPETAREFDPWTEPTPLFPARSTSPMCISASTRLGEAGSCRGAVPGDRSFGFDIAAPTVVHIDLVNEFHGAIVLYGEDDQRIATAATPDPHGTASLTTTLPAGHYRAVITVPGGESGRYQIAWALDAQAAPPRRHHAG